VGRGDEATKYLDEALKLARDLKNDGLVAQTLDYQSDAAYYRGDLKTAKSLYQKASQAAERTTETDKKLIAKLNLAKLDMHEGRAREAVATLHSVVQKADALGLKYIAIRGSLLTAEAMVQLKDYSHAKSEADQILLRAEKLGLQPISATAHFLLATIARAGGNSSEAQDQYRQVVRLLEPMAKEKGAEKVLQGSDLSAMYTESNRLLQAAK
jgi:tetratricopeptide (TPR) repeat protein